MLLVIVNNLHVCYESAALPRSYLGFGGDGYLSIESIEVKLMSIQRRGHGLIMRAEGWFGRR
jgi:hypothetical protein